MEDSIYRMSLAEGLLVLIVIGLWLLAVINLVRKLERICNPPSIYLNYSTHNTTSLSPSTFHEHYQNNLIPTSSRPSAIHFIRALSEPAIDASPRTAIHMRSPSETWVHSKTSISQQMSSRTTVEIEASNSSINFPEENSVEIIRSQHITYPKRLPSIIKRSLLDLHRRALFPNTSLNTSLTRCVIITTDNPTISRFPLMKRKYQREDAKDEHECYSNPPSNN